MTNSILENPYRVIGWFLNRNSTNQKGMAWLFKVMKGKILQQRLFYPARLIQIYWRNKKFSRQAKIKRIKHRKTSFTTNTKGTSLSRHTSERKDLYKTNPKQLRKWFILLLLFSRSVVSNSLQPHGLQHTRLPCPSLSTRVCSNSCTMSRWSHPTFSSSVIPFCLESFPASRSFLISQLFTLSGQGIGASASASVLPKNIQCWFPLGLTSLISLQSKGLSSLLQHHSSKASILWCSAYHMVQLSHPHTTRKTIPVMIQNFVGKVMSLLFNILSRLVTAFLARSKHLLISWLQSPSAVIFEPKKIKSMTVSIVSPTICHEVMGLDAMILVFWMLTF